VQVKGGVSDVLPGIDSRPVGLVIVGLKPLAGGQLYVRHHEIQLDPTLVAVLHPETLILVGV